MISVGKFISTKEFAISLLTVLNEMEYVDNWLEYFGLNDTWDYTILEAAGATLTVAWPI